MQFGEVLVVLLGLRQPAIQGFSEDQPLFHPTRQWRR